MTPARPAAPRPVVAGLLSLVVPGLGQVYAGAERRAFVAWPATEAMSTVFLILFVREPGLAGYTCVTAGAVLVTLANVLDGARTARRAATAGVSSHWGPRWPAVTVIGLLFALGVQPAFLAALRHSAGETYIVPSSSMAPGVLAGDWITSVPIGPDAVKRGANLVFHAWNGEILIKRVVGLPGDTIAMRNDTLMIDGRSLREPYVYAYPDTNLGNQTDAQFEWQRAHLTAGASAQAYRPTDRTWGPLVVPPDSVFVLGDNRENSLDSRDRGFVARSAFFQRPTGIYFSRDPEDKQVRWRRIGMRIE